MRYLKRNAMKKRKQNSQASAEPSPLTTPSSTTFQLHVVRECSRMDLQHEGGPQLPRPRHAFYRHQSRTSLSKRKQNCQASPEPPFQYAIEFWRSSFARMPVGVASKIKRLSSSLPAVHLQHEGGPRCNVADKGKTLPQNKLDLQRISAISLMIFQCLFIFVRCPSLNILI